MKTPIHKRQTENFQKIFLQIFKVNFMQYIKVIFLRQEIYLQEI